MCKATCQPTASQALLDQPSPADRTQPQGTGDGHRTADRHRPADGLGTGHGHRTVMVQVARQEPGQAPRTEDFAVPLHEGMTVLDVLDWIKEHADASLTYRWSCRSAVCGSCGVQVNGSPVLACETFAQGYAASGMVIEPLRHLDVQRDLVVDTDGLISHLALLGTWMMPDAGLTGPLSSTVPAGTQGLAGAVTSGDLPIATRADAFTDTASVDGAAVGTCAADNTAVADVVADDVVVDDVLGQLAAMHRQSPDQVAQFAQLSQCIDCMLCLSACPALDQVAQFVGPAALATARRWDMDSRDQGNDVRWEQMVENEFGVWPCTQELACTRVCPQGVDPAKAILAVQRLAMNG